MKKVAFIVPGFFQSTSEEPYQTIGGLFREKGFTVIFVDIHWKNRQIADYVDQFRSSFSKNRGELNVFFGFSLGGTAALLASPEFRPDALYLCSMAPYFKEDISVISEEDRVVMGKRRWDDIKDCSFDSAAKNISCPVTIFFGGNEKEFVKRRVQLAEEKIKHVTVIEIPDVGHKISDERYLASIKNNLDNSY